MKILRDIMWARYGTPTETRSSGELHYPCPKCGGEDRFIVRPDGEQGYCRQCYWQPDAIQYLREIDGQSFPEAAAEVGKALPPRDPRVAIGERRLKREFAAWREHLWMQAYQALRLARGRLVNVQFAQRCFARAPLTFTAEEKAAFACELMDAELDFQAAQEAFSIVDPERDQQAALKIWEEVRAGR